MQRAPLLHGHQQPVTDTELRSTVSSHCCILLAGAHGPPGQARRSWPERGGSSLLSLLAAPASEAPRLPTSPPAQKTATPMAEMKGSQPENYSQTNPVKKN